MIDWCMSGTPPSTQRPRSIYTASMAKAIVGGVSLGIALTDRRMTLDDTVASYVPHWKRDPRKSRITIRQLGSHTSGLKMLRRTACPTTR